MLNDNGLCQRSVHKACYYFYYSSIILTGFKFYGVTRSSTSHPFLCTLAATKLIWTVVILSVPRLILNACGRTK